MTSEERLKKQRELIEYIGRAHDKDGFQPIAGRIIALLTVMDKEQYTFDEIVADLQISKSSASNALKILESMQMVEYTTLPGDRKRYFHMKRKDKFMLIDQVQQSLQTKCDILKQVLELKANKDTPNSILIKDMIDMIEFFLNKNECLKQEYEKK